MVGNRHHISLNPPINKHTTTMMIKPAANIYPTSNQEHTVSYVVFQKIQTYFSAAC